MDSIYPILSFVLMALWILRIFKLRPHKRANIITFFMQLIIVGILSAESLPAEGIPSIAISVALYTWILHLLAKWRDRRKMKALIAKYASTQSGTASTKPDSKTSTTSQQGASTAATKTNTKTTTTSQQGASTAATKTNTKTTTSSQQKQTREATPSPAPAQKIPLVQQTLTTCVRCGKPLQGPKCKHCGFDHTAESIFLLCPVAPEKLQIRIDQRETSR